jgi:hypothetical protein
MKWKWAVGLASCAAAAGCVPPLSDAGLANSRAGRIYRVTAPAGEGVRPGAFTVRLDQPGPADRRRLLGALGAVRRVFDDADFRREVRRARWLETADGDLLESGDTVVEHLLDGPTPAFDVLVNPQSVGQWLGLTSKIVATADVCSHISLRPERVAQWDAGAPGLLVNTLAHEVSHLLAADGCGGGGVEQAVARYRDDGYSECTRLFLVSYKMGDMAQCFYEARAGGVPFGACINGRVNGGSFPPGRDRVSAEAACAERLHRRSLRVASNH